MMQQASVGDYLSFDPFSFDEVGLAASEVDVGRGQIAGAFVVASVIVVGDGRVPISAPRSPGR